jgi:hypothetical protein
MFRRILFLALAVLVVLVFVALLDPVLHPGAHAELPPIGGHCNEGGQVCDPNAPQVWAPAGDYGGRAHTITYVALHFTDGSGYQWAPQCSGYVVNGVTVTWDETNTASYSGSSLGLVDDYYAHASTSWEYGHECTPITDPAYTPTPEVTPEPEVTQEPVDPVVVLPEPTQEPTPTEVISPPDPRRQSMNVYIPLVPNGVALSSTRVP